MTNCESFREWLRGELEHLVESRPGSLSALITAAARLAVGALGKMRESGEKCRVEAEARVYSDPLRPLDATISVHADADSGEASVCTSYVVSLEKLCNSLREAIRGKNGGEAASALRGLLEATAEALRVFESHADNVNLEESQEPRLVLRYCERVEGEPEETAEKLLFTTRRLAEELGVKLE